MQFRPTTGCWKRLRHLRLPHAVIGLLLCLSLVCRAAPQERETIRQMLHTTWTGRNGAPQGITALAQTPDGRLWIGTVAGLYYYDGFTFNPFPLPVVAGKPIVSRKVQSLFVSRDGGLWVIGLATGAVYIRGAQATDAGMYAGLHARFDSLVEDRSGRIWAVVNDRLLAWCGPDHLWHVAPGPTAHSTLLSGIFFDSKDTLWVVADDLLYRRGASAAVFQKTSVIAEGGIHYAEAGDGSIWLVGQAPKRYKGEIRGTDLRRLAPDGHLLPFPFRHSDVNAVLARQHSSLWVLENDIGAYGERNPALTRHEWLGDHWQTDRITSTQGFGDSDAHAMIEDADGNIWIGGERQLERFRASALVPVAPGLVGNSWILCADAYSDGIWVGSRSGLLLRVTGGQVLQLHGQDGPYKLTCRHNGSSWMLDARGLSLVSSEGIRRFPLLAGHGPYLDNWGFSDVLETRDGRLIVAEHGAKESRLCEWLHGTWVPFAPALNGRPIHASVEDASGDLYFAGLDDFIAVVHGSETRSVPIMGGTLGSVAAFQQIPSGLIALGLEGIAVYRSGVFQRLVFARPEDGELVSGLQQGPEGDIWINGRRGIVRVALAEWRQAMADPEHRIQGTELHEGDFIGPAMTGIASASAAKDGSGRLWFGTLNGVVSLNPSALGAPIRAPVLQIASADADGHPFGDHAVLPPRVSTVRVRYMGLNITKPESVVYSYRLDGADADWQSVGKRTEAVYTGLKPGRYRLQVKASYGDGNWTQPIGFNLRIRPAFYQTWPFLITSVLLCLLLVWGTISMRSRALANALKEQWEQRADERVRIARDLHDTLLQGMHGLMMSFHVAARSTPKEARLETC